MGATEYIEIYNTEYNKCLSEAKKNNASDPADAASNLFAETCNNPAAMIGYYFFWYGKDACSQWKANTADKKHTDLMMEVDRIFETMENMSKAKGKEKKW